MCLNAGEVTVSFALPLAGSVTSAETGRPAGSGGGACAKADVGRQQDGCPRLSIHDVS